MGMCNAPAIHQRRVTAALRPLLGDICHIYLDDIVIWSQSVEDHIRDVDTVLSCLRNNSLYCNKKKSKFFQTEIDFLGHHISTRGIEADEHKAQRILDWPKPKTATETRAFLGLVRYILAFLPDLAKHSGILDPFTTKEAEKFFPEWGTRENEAFQAIKALVASRDCLTIIDHSLLATHKIYVTTDASDTQSGAVLSFGTTWEAARPVAFDSKTFKDAELNYPVHEKELLAIIRALKKWRADLIGVPFLVYTDHKTLENFHQQKDLSRRQCRWMEFLSQYDCKFVYIAGADNTVADALSRTSFLTSTDADAHATRPYPAVDEKGHCSTDDITVVLAGKEQPDARQVPYILAIGPATAVTSGPFVGATLSIQYDEHLLRQIRAGYLEDPWCHNLLTACPLPDNISLQDGLLFTNNRLIIPRVNAIREEIFRLAHDTLGHFGFEKTYGSIRDSFYWPNMRRDLQRAYIPGCADCQRNKNSTAPASGPLHPLPVPDARGDSVAIDFLGPLPLDEGYDQIIIFTDRLGSDIRIVPSRTTLNTEGLARIFIDHWFCENGLPTEIVSDRDKLFVNDLWTSIHGLLGISLKLSTAYHPQSDGASERTNKTITQCLRFHVERNQRGWVRALPRIRFNMMNTVNASTGFTPFQLRMGRAPRLLPPITPHAAGDEPRARDIVDRLRLDVAEAQDNLLQAKINQAYQANKHRKADFPFQVGGRALLSTLHRRRQFLKANEKRVAKFLPRYDGPYKILKVDPAHSTVTLQLPDGDRSLRVFHSSLLLPFTENDDSLFPSRKSSPHPVRMHDGSTEFVIQKILDERRVGRGYQYLVRWRGEGPEEDRWLPRRELEDCEALDIWLQRPQ